MEEVPWRGHNGAPSGLWGRGPCWCSHSWPVLVIRCAHLVKIHQTGHLWLTYFCVHAILQYKVKKSQRGNLVEDVCILQMRYTCLNTMFVFYYSFIFFLLLSNIQYTWCRKNTSSPLWQLVFTNSCWLYYQWEEDCFTVISETKLLAYTCAVDWMSVSPQTPMWEPKPPVWWHLEAGPLGGN